MQTPVYQGSAFFQSSFQFYNFKFPFMGSSKKNDQKSKPAGSTKAPKSFKHDQIDAQLSMMENLAMINIRRFGLKGHHRTSYVDQVKEKDQSDRSAPVDDQVPDS